MGGWSGHGFDVANRVSIALEPREFRKEVPSIVLVGVEVPGILAPLRQSYWRRRGLDRGNLNMAARTIQETHILARERGNGGRE